MVKKGVAEKTGVELFRIIVGFTFLFSGFVKAVDPLGFTYKIQDYLIELNLTELFQLAMPVALFFVVAEFLLGAMLLIGAHRKWTARLIGLFMIFFTPFTLWVAIANPVEDCGCFGDALVISNWQTFYKNLVLLVGAILLIINWSVIKPVYSKKTGSYAALFIAVFGLSFALYNVYREPVIDFRSYKIGADIPELMYVNAEDADIYETIFVYSKDGEEQEFTEEDYPWNDSTWTFVDMKNSLVKEGVKPEIEDFAIEVLYYDDFDNSWNFGGDITDLILSDTSYTFITVSYSLDKMSVKSLSRLKEISRFALDNGFPFYFVTASSLDVLEKWEDKYQTEFQFCHADERVLKTMIRTNPGLMLLKEGVVINKWDYIAVPTDNSDLIERGNASNETKMLVIAIIFLVPLIIMRLIDSPQHKTKKN